MGSVEETVFNRYVENRIATGPNGFRLAYDPATTGNFGALAGREYDLFPAAAKIDARILLMYGRDSHFIDRQAIERMRLIRPDLELRKYRCGQSAIADDAGPGPLHPGFPVGGLKLGCVVVLVPETHFDDLYNEYIAATYDRQSLTENPVKILICTTPERPGIPTARCCSSSAWEYPPSIFSGSMPCR